MQTSLAVIKARKAKKEEAHSAVVHHEKSSSFPAFFAMKDSLSLFKKDVNAKTKEIQKAREKAIFSSSRALLMDDL